MKLSLPTRKSLAPNAVEESKFYFRNFVSILHILLYQSLVMFCLVLQYPRFRRGNCSFAINVVGRRSHYFSHTITFNTFPDPLSEHFSGIAKVTMIINRK